MPRYRYKAIDVNGALLNGELEGVSEREARQSLRDTALKPVEIWQIKEYRQFTDYFSRHSNAPPKLNSADLAEITRQLATLLGSGMSLDQSLGAIALSSENTAKSVINELKVSVLEGQSLANSMMRFPKAFPTMYSAMIASAEQSGNLESVLEELADYTQEQHDNTRKIQTALIYPVMLVVLAIVIVAALLTWVVPDIVAVFDEQGQSLPWMTKALMAVSYFFSHYWFLMLVGIILVVVLIRLLLRKTEYRLRWDKAFLSLPLFGDLSRGINLSRFVNTLHNLVASGVPLVDSLSIACEVLTNQHLKFHILAAAINVQEGESLHVALNNTQEFPSLMIHMIHNGEVSGELQRMLAKAALLQQRKVDQTLATAISLFEPVALLVMGVMVMAIVVAILQPIFGLNELV
ncbi:MAG: general secretion pathway protein F [Pseudomonadales bacterium]|jgi:general secretion pathway protein F